MAAAPSEPAPQMEPTPAEPVPVADEPVEAPVVAAEGEAAEAPKRRVQLNPTVNEAEIKAVPTYGVGDAAATVEGMAAASAPYMQGPTGPVDVPRAESLDAGLEAEINAAMSGAMTSAPAVTGDVTSEVTVAPGSEDQLEPGSKLKAKVQSVNTENVFCEIGFRSPGLLPIKQFPAGKHPREGEEFLVVVDKYDAENGVVLISLPKATRRPRGNWEELAVGQIVECVVNKTNKGGLEVTVSNMRAFLPASQVDVGFVSSLETYVGQRFPVQVTEVNPAKRNLVVSRRALVIQERKEKAGVFWEQVEVGQQYAGAVKTLKDYGAFVDLGGVDGFLHVGEMSWTRIKHPSDLLQEGQAVDVVVLSLDREKQKIGLGMRQLAQNPWNIAVEKYGVGTTASGRVTRISDFGAFVELEAGVEGLIHISELDHKRVKRVGDVLNVGQEIQAQVLEVNPERQRISLSLKALKAKPEEPKDEDMAPSKGQSYERKRKEPLRGGTGTQGGGGLFGNPGDYGR
ncbi:S1 RNA-binding domain-containing protein [bacterium]|nr:S1 RNA-binding domain-containing protein [bacterium]